MIQTCPVCEGTGITQQVKVVAGYGHHPNCDGSCRLCPIPVPEQRLEIEPCDNCFAEGFIADSEEEWLREIERRKLESQTKEESEC